MSHEIESMAWTNEVPWHGLGVKVDGNLSAEQMLKAAGLDWTVSMRPFGLIETVGDKHKWDGKVVPKYFALTRDSDDRVFDVTGDRFTATQNHQAFEFFKSFVEAGDATMETAGALMGGRLVWGLARLKADFMLGKADKVNAYLLMALPHKKGKSIIAKTVATRVVCNNTLQMAFGESGTTFRMPHLSVFDEKAHAKAKVALGIAHEQVDQFKETCIQLTKIKMGVDDQIVALSHVLDPDSVGKSTEEIKELDRSKILTLAIEALTKSPGSQLPTAKNTAWGVVNAVTYVTDHMIGRGADQRLSKAWFGRNATLKARMVKHLLAA